MIKKLGIKIMPHTPKI